MNNEEIIREVADILEVDESEINEEKKLDEYDTWDSIAVLAVISLINEKKGVFLHASEINSLKTVKDLINLIG